MTAFVLAAGMLAPQAALADSANCSDAPFFGVIDGDIYPNAPDQITIDANCTIRNYPASNPLDANISFYAPGGGSWLIIYDNVVHTGQMSCNSNEVHEHKIWFTNSSSSGIHASCRDLFIPVEKIDKASPSPTAAIGVPFTYTLTIPVLYDANSGAVVDNAGSPNALHGITVWDNLNETGASLSLVDYEIYWESTGDPVTHSFTNNNGELTWELGDEGVIVPADTQFVIEVTVVLDDVQANVPGTTFVNTAKWDFGRLIEDVFYDPLPGEWGVSEPMTIAAPQLIVTKTGPATLGRTLNLGQWGEFAIDVHNTDLAGDLAVTDAFNLTLIDRLPDGPNGGMCDITPEILSAQVFQSDASTPVPGKDPLVDGVDFVMTYDPTDCELTLTMLSANTVIGAGEHLIVTYRTQLDPDTQDGISLTNVTGATDWFNDDSSNAERVHYSRIVTDGTPGTADHQDEHTIQTALYGFFFEKTVANLTNGANPATIAAPGSTLRYTLRLQSTDVALSGMRFLDDLGAMNGVVFEPGSLTVVAATLGGADATNTLPNGGTNSAGLLDIRDIDLPAYSEVSIQFDIRLAAAIPNGTIVSNQAQLWDSVVQLAVSDDPYVNGQADPDIDGDEDPTRLTIESIPLFEVEKVSDDIDGDPDLLFPGDRLRYTITVRNVGTSDAVDAALRDPIPANTAYVPGSTMLNGAPVADGPGDEPPFATALLLSTPLDATPGFMPADATPGAGNVATVTFEVRIDDATADGTLIENQGFVSSPGFSIVDVPSDDPATPAIDDPTRDLVGDVPFLFAVKQAALELDGNQPGIVDPGDTLRYTITIQNNGGNPATDVVLRDAVPANTTYVADSLTLNGEPVGQPDGGISPLIAGIGVASADLTPPLPGPSGGTVSGGEAAVVEFLLRVDDGTAPGTLIINQALVASTELEDLPTDGDGDPLTGPEPTVVVVGDVPIAPAFDVDKLSVDIDGDPDLLMAGERLRYTILVRNIGTADAYDAVLRDPIPANTTYVPGTTTLNGAPVPDGPGNTPPFLNGMALSTPVDATPGFLPAVVLPGADNTAAVTFEVLVDADAIDGTVIANQGFVSAPADNIFDQPSDDPFTATVDDPTRDIVGALPLLYAEKSAVLENDAVSIGIVDPGDVLRYSIRIRNDGSVPATEVVLQDAVPANTTYVADSLTLNGEPVGQPDGGVSPLVAGIDISSDDLTPPLPGPGAGTISADGSALVEFLLRVDDLTPPGTLIVNQATVESAESPDLLTDGDGNPATGPEPTVVVVGDVQAVSITKQVSVVGGGSVLAGATLEYVVSVLNISSVPATDIVIRDDLDLPVAGQLLYVDDSATVNGSSNGIVVTGAELAMFYSNVYGDLEPGESIAFRFRAMLDANLPDGTVVPNTATVYWNDPQQMASATVSVTIGGVPGVGVLSGAVWHDADFDDVADGGERLLEGWTVDLYRNGGIVHSTMTDVDGLYRIAGVAPTYQSDDRYEIRFAAPGAGPNTAALGETFSDFINGLQVISDIAVESGSNLLNLHLPIDPNGVVYNAAARTALGGAALTLLDAGGAPLPATCFDDPAQQGQVTLGDGFYKFNINFADPACPEGADYLISVTPPAGNFIAGESEMIPPATGSTTGPLSVPGCLNGGIEDAIPASPQYCEATASELAPGLTVAAGSAGTTYYLHLSLDNSSNPGSRQIFNNHIPLDPDLRDSVTISKTSPAISVNRGQLVPYLITVSNDLGFDLTGVSIVDRFPVGFRYVEGSARVDGTPTEPTVNGRELSWDGLVLPGAGRHRIELLLAVGAGVSEGEFVNRALVVNSVSGNPVSSEATATVRLVPDPDFDCTDVLGKVYDDANANGIQDADEPGIPGVRLVTATGLSATTDNYGRYHITCATVPNETRGSNFVMKLDDRTLPTGFRALGDAVQIQRATRGKALRFNFSASIDRVIGLDVADPIFIPDATELRPQWQPRLGILLAELETAPAVLRISYLADIEEPALVQRRLDALERDIRLRWEEVGSYPLRIEAEVFWRLGSPPDQPGRLRREGR